MIGDQDELETLWLQKKWGMFSASNMHKLLSKGAGEMFGAGAKSYIEEVARQGYTAFNTRDSVEKMAMKMGKIDEPQAFGYLYQILGIQELVYHGAEPVFVNYCPDSGCSPDSTAVRPDGTVSFGAELKCPTGKVHWEYLKDVKDHNDLSRYLDHYAQCQFAMMTFKTDHWIWGSYNEYFPKETRMLLIEVPANPTFQMNLDIRIKNAVKEKYRIIDEMKSRFLN